MTARMQFEFPIGRGAPRRRARGDDDAPIRLLVLADLSARESRGACESGDLLAARPPISVDADRIDAAMSRLRPGLELAPRQPATPAIMLEPTRLDHLHPDHLYETLDGFEVLRQTRARLLDPRTFAATAEALGHAVRPPGPAPAEAASRDDDDALLGRLLGQGRRPAGQRADVTGLLRALVSPHVVPDADPRQPELVASVDEATTALMRAVLHHPAFRALEASWRSVHFLVSRLDVGATIEVHLLDVTKRELAADLRAAVDLQRSGLYRVAVEQSGRALGEAPWTVIVGDMTFGPEAEDLELLAALGAVASHAGGPFLAAADPRLLGCASLVESPEPRTWQVQDGDAASRWTTLRHSGSAPWVGLALPRLLLRLPYGKKTDPVERFAFEEMSAPGDHASYLWGNPAFACAALMAEAAADARGSDVVMSHRKIDERPQDVDDLPAHVFSVDGESQLKPCAEVYLSERAGEAILQHGLMPVLSYPNRNAARVMRFQSIAEPAAALAGAWQ